MPTNMIPSSTRQSLTDRAHVFVNCASEGTCRKYLKTLRKLKIMFTAFRASTRTATWAIFARSAAKPQFRSTSSRDLSAVQSRIVILSKATSK